MKKPNTLKRQIIQTAAYFIIGGFLLWGLDALLRSSPEPDVAPSKPPVKSGSQPAGNVVYHERGFISEGQDTEDTRESNIVVAQVPDIQCSIRHVYRPNIEYGIRNPDDDYAHVEVFSYMKQFRVQFISFPNNNRMNPAETKFGGNIDATAAQALKKYAQQCVEAEKARNEAWQRRNPRVRLPN